MERKEFRTSPKWPPEVGHYKRWSINRLRINRHHSQKVTSDDEVERQNDQCHIGWWENKTPRLVVTRKAVKKAIWYSAKLRKIGWTDERLKLELSCLAQSVIDDSSAGQPVAAICTRNRISPQQDDIPLLAMEAYEHYQGFGPRKGFKVQLKKINAGALADTVMRLALYIALINPCLGRPWGKQYTRQGHVLASVRRLLWK